MEQQQQQQQQQLLQQQQLRPPRSRAWRRVQAEGQVSNLQDDMFVPVLTCLGAADSMPPPTVDLCSPAVLIRLLPALGLALFGTGLCGTDIGSLYFETHKTNHKVCVCVCETLSLWLSCFLLACSPARADGSTAAPPPARAPSPSTTNGWKVWLTGTGEQAS